MPGRGPETAAPPSAADTGRADVVARYRAVRALTEALAAYLSPEDQVVQSMTEASPAKWHRAHTTWFFETFVLQPYQPGYEPFHPSFRYLFNSYYEAVGPRPPRAERGMITRPSVEEVTRYRSRLDSALADFVETTDAATLTEAWPRIELGLHHEQQHQELLLMDQQHAFSRNPLEPAFVPGGEPLVDRPGPLVWVEDVGGLVEIGHDPSAGFAFDNEGPRHRVFLEPFALADRLVTATEWLAFIDDGGYERPELWLSDGWATARAERWRAPLYWERDGESWTVLTLRGRRALVGSEPVVHVSHYEADAYARWAGARLPTEFEWEHAAASVPVEGHFLPGALESAALHPLPDIGGEGLRQLYGDVWEWTSSAYLPYPRFAPAGGAIGEYNGKFMNNQIVLRGGACVTPAGHLRPTYRNFFWSSARWLYGGVRLARDLR